MAQIAERQQVETVSGREKVEAPWQKFLSDYSESYVAVGAFIILLIIVLAAILAPLFTPQNPYDLAQVDILDSRQPPGSKSFAGYTFLLGSDGAGRDLFSAILYGLRISLSVGVVSGFVALIIGSAIGLIATYIVLRCRHHRCSLGLNTSRNRSPTRLMETMVMSSMTPGKKLIQ